MNKVIFIIPYFGKLNNYFQLFLNSCKYNNDYNWLIFTDDDVKKYDCPQNVKIINCEFKELTKKIDKKIGFKTMIFSPYKLCDLKPMYGYIFNEYIKDYEYWGYCDIDLIFGKLSNFIDLKILNDYDKIGVLGHFSIIKNCKELNELFLKDNRYKLVLTSEKSLKFDEEYGEDFGKSINNIFKENEKNIYPINSFADIYVKSSFFKITHYLGKNNGYDTEKKDKSIFVWDKGNLYKYIFKGKKIEKKDYMYIHLQKRNMKLKKLKNYDFYKIIPNTFEDLHYVELKKEKRYYINLHYFKIRSKNLKIKIINKLGE